MIVEGYACAWDAFLALIYVVKGGRVQAPVLIGRELRLLVLAKTEEQQLVEIDVTRVNFCV